MPPAHQGAGGGVRRARISLIAALADDGVIGIDNRLPWRLPADLRWFKQQTMGKPIVMGRKTFDSLGRRPLPGRTNIVVTTDPRYRAPGCIVVHSLDEALRATGDADEVMIIGGASLYAQALPRADRLYLTYVHGRFAGDAHFPVFDTTQWREVRREDHPADDKNPWPYSFVILDRLKASQEASA